MKNIMIYQDDYIAESIDLLFALVIISYSI